MRNQNNRTPRSTCIFVILIMFLVLANHLLLVQQVAAQAPAEWSIIVDESLNEGAIKGDVSNIQTDTDLVTGDIVVTNNKALWWKVYVSNISNVDIDKSNLLVDDGGTYLLLAPKGNSATDAYPTLPPSVIFHQPGSAVFFYADRTTASGFKALSLQVAEIALIALTGGGVPTSFVDIILQSLNAPPFIAAAVALGQDPPDFWGAVEAISSIASDSEALVQLQYLLIQLGVPMTIAEIVDALCVLRIFQILVIMYDIFTSPFADYVAFQAIEVGDEPLIAVIKCNPTWGTAPLVVNFNASDSYSQYPIESYEWDFGDGEADTGVAPTHSYLQPGKYTVTLTVTNSHGRQSTANRTLTVSQQRIQVIGEAEKFQLTFEAGDFPVVLLYSWDFGDGGTAEGKVVNHTYSSVGEYVVILTLGLDIGDPTQDWVPWVSWDTIKVTLVENPPPADWSFKVDKYEGAPESIALNGIIVEDADEVWTNSFEYSANLINATKVVGPRIVVEYADSITEFGLQDSEELNLVASAVTSRIVVEYADAIISTDLRRPPFVPRISTTLSFSLRPNPAYVGQTVTLLGNLTDAYDHLINNTRVHVYVNGTSIGYLFTNSSGWFKTTSKAAPAGTYIIKVSYNGSEISNPSSHMETLRVYPKTDTKVSFTLSPSPATVGETVTLLGNVTDQHDNPIEDAAVEVYYSKDNVTWHYAGTLYSNSTGSFSTSGVPPSPGTYSLAVLYRGSYKYNRSWHIETLTVNPKET